MIQTSMLTTIDNPFNPFEDFAAWYVFDMDKGYNCSERVARLANLSDDLTDSEANERIEAAIDNLIKYDPLGKFMKIKMKAEESSNETLKDTADVVKV